MNDMLNTYNDISSVDRPSHLDIPLKNKIHKNELSHEP